MKINKRYYLYAFPIFLIVALILTCTDSEVISIYMTYMKSLQLVMFNCSPISIVRIACFVLAFASYIMYFISNDKR
jgi:hypothetical protein